MSTGSEIRDVDAWIREKVYLAEALKIERLSGQTLPMEQCYINMAIVKQSDRVPDRVEEDPAQGSSPFTLLARLKVEEPHEEQRVELPELFNARKIGGQEHLTRRILIWGRAGVGKTTLCKKIVHEFVRQPVDQKLEWKKLFDRVLWVPLRHLKRLPNDNLSYKSLFVSVFFGGAWEPDRFAEALLREVRSDRPTSVGNRTLFILDGLDELSQELNRESSIFQFLRELLDQPNVIITSRPYGNLPADLKPLDLKLEVVGFYTNQVRAYIKTAFTDSGTNECDILKFDGLQSFLQTHALIQDLVRIPIQLDALCYTWSAGRRSQHVPETMTALYKMVVGSLWRKDFEKLQALREAKKGVPRSSAQIMPLVEKEVLFLQILAFTGLKCDILNYYPHYLDSILKCSRLQLDSDLEDTLARLSFIRTSDLASKTHQNSTYHFIHLTYQEYFAAEYFVRQWISGRQLDCLDLNTGINEPVGAEYFLLEAKYDARYDIFWRFVAGLLQSSGDKRQSCQFFDTIEKEPRDLLVPTHERLVMHCLAEVPAQDETLTIAKTRTRLEDRLSQLLLFQCTYPELAGPASLAGELEMPEQVLDKVLKKGSEYVRKMLLKYLRTRTTISLGITHIAASWLRNDVSTSLRIDILYVLQISSVRLSGKIQKKVTILLKDSNSDVRRAAVRVLRDRADLSQESLYAVTSMLKDPNRDIRRTAVDVLGGQTDLSQVELKIVT